MDGFCAFPVEPTFSPTPIISSWDGFSRNLLLLFEMIFLQEALKGLPFGP